MGNSEEIYAVAKIHRPWFGMRAPGRWAHNRFPDQWVDTKRNFYLLTSVSKATFVA